MKTDENRNLKANKIGRKSTLFFPFGMDRPKKRKRIVDKNELGDAKTPLIFSIFGYFCSSGPNNEFIVGDEWELSK